MKKSKSVLRRKARIRKKIRGTNDRPRFSVFRSNRFIYGQLVNDGKGVTLISVSEKSFKNEGKSKKVDRAKEVGKLLAKKALEKKIKKVVFDKGSYAYKGRVRAFAEGAREGGLKF